MERDPFDVATIMGTIYGDGIMGLKGAFGLSFIDELRERAEVTLQQGVSLPSGGRLRVSVDENVLVGGNGRSADHKILASAITERDANPDRPNEVWSGRGKQPRWVADKLASGLALRDLSIENTAVLRLMRA